MNKQFVRQTVFRFRQFRRKGYAAFCSMHKIVNIGRVSARIADMELLKAGKAAAVCGLLLTLSLIHI